MTQFSVTYDMIEVTPSPAALAREYLQGEAHYWIDGREVTQMEFLEAQED